MILFISLILVGSNALRWEQKFSGTRIASFGGLLSVNQLFCCCQAASHRRLPQCCPCAQKTCIVSAIFRMLKL